MICDLLYPNTTVEHKSLHWVAVIKYYQNKVLGLKKKKMYLGTVLHGMKVPDVEVVKKKKNSCVADQNYNEVEAPLKCLFSSMCKMSRLILKIINPSRTLCTETTKEHFF